MDNFFGTPGRVASFADAFPLSCMTLQIDQFMKENNNTVVTNTRGGRVFQGTIWKTTGGKQLVGNNWWETTGGKQL